MEETLNTATTRAPGERIDRLAERLYGHAEDGAVEALLAANPGLGDVSELIPAGRMIIVPSFETADSDEPLLRPWD